MSLSRRTYFEGRRGVAPGGQRPRIWRPWRRPSADSGAPADSADPVRAWQWRSRGAVDDHAVADGIQRRAARPDVRDQFHRPAGARRRRVPQAEPILDRRPAPRTRRRHQGIEAPHRRAARGAGRQFARRQSDPQLYQERRRRRCQPRRAVRRSQPRRLSTGTRRSATNSTAAGRSCAG